jgi:hypothetical protein
MFFFPRLFRMARVLLPDARASVVYEVLGFHIGAF